jgi:UDP-3-O-[3-hydroxymyristoyl] glucosamine N-acyltransferase
MPMKKCVKETMKYVLGYFRLNFKKVRVSFSSHIYVGKGVHICNGRKVNLGKGIQIRPYCDLFANPQIYVGDGCDIGTRNRIDGNVTIGKFTLIGPDNYISSNTHIYSDPNIPITKGRKQSLRTIIAILKLAKEVGLELIVLLLAMFI